MTHSVAIVQRRLTHYRVPLFELMREQLADEGVTLRVLHGEGTPEEASKRDAGTLPWAEHLPTRYLAGRRVCWQPFWSRVSGCDLVVVTQENKLLHNLLPLLNPWRRTPLAFWGHGGNLQSASPGGPAEVFKRWTTRRVDWWFAYTELSARLVRETGFDAARMTVLNNSIDTAALRADVQRARAEPRDALRQRLGLGAGPVGLFIGSLYPEKRLPFLLQAAQALHQRLPGFQLAIAGAGPEADWVREMAAQHAFIRALGPLRDQAKAEWLAAADMMLNPGLVGLGILDAFIAGLPLVTTDCGLHSPEIAYLDAGVNGLMTADSLDAFVGACVELLADPRGLQGLRDAAVASAARYSVQNMAERFSKGISLCLASRSHVATSERFTP